jgi:hypothetical protein
MRLTRLIRLIRALDTLDALEWRKVVESIGMEMGMQRRGWLEQCVWHKQCAERSPTALEIVARPRLKLYNDKTLRPDPVALSLFLSQANKDILNDSRRFILQFFGSSLSPPNATEQEEVDPATARKRCSDFFDSKAIGDVVKWRLLTSVVFPTVEMAIMHKAIMHKSHNA